MTTSLPPGFISTLEKGLHIIRCLSDEGSQSTIAEIARRAEFSRAATRRVLLSLEGMGYVESDGRYFRLRREMLEIGYAYLSSLPWWRTARSAAEAVALTSGCESTVAVLDGEWLVSVAHASPTKFSVFDRTVGSRMPAHAAAAGRALLAQLDETHTERYFSSATFVSLTRFTVDDPERLRVLLSEIRAAGYATATHEAEIGYTSVAVPIFDLERRAVAALEASFPVGDVASGDRVRQLVRDLSTAADGVTKTLRHN
jgi:IclR family pca regulon transcriptional regulator